MTILALHRRAIVRGAAASALGLACSVIDSQRSFSQTRFRAYPFSLGIASGDPSPDGFVIWTRLAPEPFVGGGMGSQAVDISYEIAEDETFKRVVRRGKLAARTEEAHAVHGEITGLAPARDYFFRFAAGGVQSATGRARTLPAPGVVVTELRFAALGCQRWEHGFYTAFRHVADEHLDFAFHYGDYIYEYAQLTEPHEGTPTARRMPLDYTAAKTLADYRNRYAVYKSDADLQAAHASTPFVVSFDDHEVANNWHGQYKDGVVGPHPSVDFLRRRAAAFQAWYEHMPVRRAQRPSGPNINAYRRIAMGSLLTFNVLDTRQYRTAQPCGDGWKQCPEAQNPARGMLGAAQERWLFDGFKTSATRWNVLAQQVMMMQLNRAKDAGALELHMDRWDGASAGRKRLFDAIEASKVPGIVTLTGDIHNNWAGDLKRDFNADRSATLGVEFVATSISSGGDGQDVRKSMRAMQPHNPHIAFCNDQRGYVRHVVGPDRWQADFRVLDRVSTAGAPVKTRKSLVTERMKAGVHDA